ARRFQFIREGFGDRWGAPILWDKLPEDQGEAAGSTAVKLGLQLSGIELRESPYDYEAALDQAPLEHRGMLIVPTSPSLFHDRARIADFALRHRILSMFVFREWVDAGGLLCYGPSITALFGRVAEFVDRMARGAKPPDLPMGGRILHQPCQTARCAHASTRGPRDLPMARVRCGRRFDELRNQHYRHTSPRRNLCRANSQRG